MRAAFLIVGAAALLGGCANNNAEEPAATASAAATAPGMAAMPYMQSAASSDMFEIESSRLALQRSQNPTVQAFAQMLITDHTRMSQQMMAAAQSAGLTPPPPQMLPQHAEMLQRLNAATTDFDSAYKREQIMAHQEALNLHRSYAEGGDTPALRTVASQAVPAIEAHLAQAQNLPESAPMMSPTTTRAGERGR